MKNSGINWIGSIPDEWSIVRNKNVFHCCKNIVGERSSQLQLLSLTTQGIKKKDIHNTEGKLPESFDTYQQVHQNDLVMCLFDLDCSAVFSGLSRFDGMISPAYRVLSCKENILPEYADYWFQYVGDKRKFNHYSKNIRYTLSYEDFSVLPILLPPLLIQRRITNYLSCRCAAIEHAVYKEKEGIEKLEEYKLSCITEAVTKGLDPTVPMKDSGMDWVGMIPQHWKICRLRNIGTVQNGISKSGDYFGHGSPFIAYGDVYKNFSIPKQVMGRLDSTPKEQTLYSVQTGDIFFTRTSETIDEIGFSAVCEETIPHATFAGFLIRVRPFNHYLATNFAKYYFRSNHQRYYFTKQMNLVTRASLSQDLLKSMPILLPPHNEQKEIAAYLDKKFNSIQNAITQKQEIIDKLTEYKKSLIYEVVTGKKEV